MPKITFKTLKNDKFQLDVEDGITIGDVKDKVAEERNMLREKMKLILSGKILKDTQTVAECAIKETDFLVIMGKPKPTKAATPDPAAAAAATPAPTATAAAADAAPPPAAAAAAATETPPAAAAAAPAATDSSAPSMGTPEQIAELESMGFPRSQAEAALQAAFGNQQRATEYLLNPESMPSPAAAPSSGDASASMDSAADEPAAGASGASGDHPTLSQSSPLYQYLNSPQFTSLRATLQSQPELLPSILQQIAQNQPEMAQLFNANREDFYILLNSPIQGSGGGGGGGGGGGQQRGLQIQVTPEEQAAIQRLCDLGFDRNEVIQAYIACDKNEELAANFLFMDR